MFDFHMHSTVSFDGHDSPERMVQAAVQEGLQAICFTDHIDDDPKGKDQHMRFTEEAYRQAYESLHADGLKICRGMEFGLLDNNTESAHRCAAMYPFDFIIGSIHFCEEEDIYFQPFWDGKTIHEAERVYFETMLRCVRLHDEFDVLGHLTYISKARANPLHRIVPFEEHREIIEEILRVLVSKGKGMEINTSGVDRCGDFLPPLEMVRRFRELGGEIVTVGSDAHTWDRVGQYTRRACDALSEIMDYVCTFEGRKPVFHKLK